MTKDLIQNVVEACNEFHERRLWRRFTNCDCFAVRVPGIDDPMIGAVMGAAGERYGLVLYRGPHAVADFLTLTDDAGPGDDVLDDMDMLGFDLESFGNLAPDAQALYRRARMHPRHGEKVPDFLAKPSRRRVRLPDETELTLLLLVLNGLLRADRERLLKPARLCDQEGICSVTLEGGAANPAVSVTREKFTPRSAAPIATRMSLADLRHLELLDMSWLVGAPLSRTRIEDEERSVRLLLVVDEASDLVLCASPFFSADVEEAVRTLVGTFRGHPPNGCRGVPKKVVVSSRMLYEAMAPALRKLGVTCRYQPTIEELQRIAAEFAQYMDEQVPPHDERFAGEASATQSLPAPDDLASWKEADLQLTRRFGELIRDSDVAKSMRAVRRYFDDKDFDAFVAKHQERGVVPAYISWLVLSYRPRKTSATLAEQFLAQGLPPAEDVLLRARLAAHPTIYRVAGHDPRAGTVDLEDVLLGGSVTVHDRLLSENISDNVFLVIRVYPAGQFHFLELAGPPLGIAMGDAAVAFLRDCGLKFTREGLCQGAHKFGWLWGWCDDWEATSRPPSLCNTDGDKILFHTASFAVADPLATRRALRDRHDIEQDEQDDAFTWFRDRGDSPGLLGGNVSLGRIELIGDELVLTVNSDRRFAIARQWLMELPGVTFLKVTTRGLNEPAEEIPLDDRLHTPEPAELSPDTVAAIQEIIERQSMAWIDTPLPVLDGQTPREACRTPAGRDQVTIMIRTMPDPIGQATVRVPRKAMLRELGLET